MSYPTIRPGEEHPSHDIREEGLYITDPVCSYCRLSAVDDGERLKLPCDATRLGGEHGTD